MGETGWDIAVCGLNCAKCGLYKAAKCGGCRGGLAHHWSPGCKMRSCSLERRHTFCFECNDFPCESVQSFANDGLPHHKATVANMHSMKALGVQVWVEQQPAVLFCPGFSPSR